MIARVAIATHEDKGGIQVFVVFLVEVLIMFFHFPLKTVVELHSGVDSRPSATQHRFQGVAEGIFQSYGVG